jgi:hypothetical protein
MFCSEGGQRLILILVPQRHVPVSY